MPRKGKRNKDFVAIPFAASLSLGTLGSDTVIKEAVLSGAPTEDLYVISVDTTWSMNGLTQSEVPIHVGFAHSDYSVTEIKENLDCTMLDPNDKIEQEQSRRLIRKVGVFADNSSGDMVLADGKMIRTKLKFHTGQDGLSFYAMNRTGAPLTTGAQVRISGTLYGRWIR